MATRGSGGAYVSLLLFMILAFVVGAFFGEDIRGIVRGNAVTHTPSPPPQSQASATPKPGMQTPQTSAQTVQTEQTSQTEQTTQTEQSVQLHVPAIQVYAVQLAIFSTPENARTEHDRLLEQGVQSMQYESNGRYRLLDSIHLKEEDAQAVREQYMQRNIDAYVVSLDSGTIDWNLKATPDASTLVEAAVQELRRQLLLALELPAQAQQGDRADICTQCGEITQQLKSQSELLTRVFDPDSSPLLNDLVAALNTCASLMDDVSGMETSTDLDFLAALKYNVLQCVAQYADLADAQ